MIIGDADAAAPRLTSAIRTFRDADNLVDLAATLPILANAVCAAGALDNADRHANEAIDIAQPRENVLVLASAKAALARIYAARSINGDAACIGKSREQANAAENLAAQYYLPWHLLDALQAHAELDELTGTPDEHASRINALQAWLIPAGLDPNPNNAVASGKPELGR